MYSTCVTRKRCYDTEADALDALVEHHIRFNHSGDSGPISVYRCEDCDMYHFTSKGQTHPFLHDQKEYIRKQQAARDWEDRLR